MTRTRVGAPIEDGPGAGVEYVLPLRWMDNRRDEELTCYLRRIVRSADVTVVDGSPAPVFERHARLWGEWLRHVRPDAPRGEGLNGKVVGVLTGLRLARHEVVVIADDDVRYSRRSLHEVVDRLRDADLVRPQNYYSPLPWHARWDTARILVNRAFASDYPGTLALRRSSLPDGYRQDVLFENLELIRTVRARGGREVRADDVFVARRPPTARHFWSQRVRQAYDSQAQPARLAAELALLPALLLQARRPAGYLLWSAACIGVAAAGRRRNGGAAAFGPSAPAWAPFWVAERAVTAWSALALRAAGGVPYAGSRIQDAATPERSLRPAPPEKPAAPEKGARP